MSSSIHVWYCGDARATCIGHSRLSASSIIRNSATATHVRSIDEAFLASSFLDASFSNMHRPFRISLLLGLFLYVFGLAASRASASDDVSELINEVSKANNQSLLWGPYKPNLYFGVHPRIPKSLVAGLMWAKVDNFATAQDSKC